MKKSYSVTEQEIDPTRRKLLRQGFHGLGLLACGGLLSACQSQHHGRRTLLADAGAESLLAPDENGLMLPKGFTSRVVARSGLPVIDNGGYSWHLAPDGGAVFALEDRGWVYVSNSEMNHGAGGAGAIRFDAAGAIVDAYPILQHTNRNCAGGPTPWQTWLSCEEVNHGQVWECDPLGQRLARARPALGVFNHEAAAVDPQTLQVYLTEDQPDGCLYRYTPDSSSQGIPNLDSGRLEVAEVIGGQEGEVRWHTLPDPSATAGETRRQVAAATKFRGGEGCWYGHGNIYFTTKLDNRVWVYEIANARLTLIYDNNLSTEPVLSGVDNVTVSEPGTVYVAEDGGDMQIVAITADGNIFPVVQIVGHEQSEVTGPAFDPSGTRLYFSSQRGATGSVYSGVTYEVMGPFF
ncbi:MAG TPA: alkaline phosphatase PhoX [Gammaproteobacteria bacterium]